MPVTVSDFDKPQPVSFRNDVIAALNVGGCNAGACHGTPSGKNGFKLSLRGYDPAADYLQLTRDVLGRRTDRLSPDASLILQKAWAACRTKAASASRPAACPPSVDARLARRGPARRPADLPAARRSIEVLPGSRVLQRARPLAAARRAWPTSPTAASATSPA